MASKRHQRRRACGKKRKLTQEQAKAQAYWVRKKTGSPQTIYKCKHCGWWHTGRAPKEVKQAIQAAIKRRVGVE